MSSAVYGDQNDLYPRRKPFDLQLNRSAFSQLQINPDSFLNEICTHFTLPICVLTCIYTHLFRFSCKFSEYTRDVAHIYKVLCITYSASAHFVFKLVLPFLIADARHAELTQKFIEIFVSLPTALLPSVDTTRSCIHSLENPKLHELHRCKQGSSTPLPQEHTPSSTISAHPDPRHNILGLLANRHTRCSVDPCSAPPGQ